MQVDMLLLPRSYTCFSLGNFLKAFVLVSRTGWASNLLRECLKGEISAVPIYGPAITCVATVQS